MLQRNLILEYRIHATAESNFRIPYSCYSGIRDPQKLFPRNVWKRQSTKIVHLENLALDSIVTLYSHTV